MAAVTSGDRMTPLSPRVFIRPKTITEKIRRRQTPYRAPAVAHANEGKT